MAISFKSAHFPQEIILTCVRWYVGVFVQRPFWCPRCAAPRCRHVSSQDRRCSLVSMSMPSNTASSGVVSVNPAVVF